MDPGTLRGMIAVLTFATFGGICWWAYRSKNRSRFEQDALLPFADDAVQPPSKSGASQEEVGHD